MVMKYRFMSGCVTVMGPRFDLLAEDGDDAAAGADDVSESDGDESRGAIIGVEGLHVELGASFGCAHHAGRVHGFVGADHDEGGSATITCCVSDGARAEDVVLDRFAGIALHHRDVLMSGAVEDYMRLMVLEYLADAASIANIGNHRNDLRADPAMAQLAIDFKKIVFGLIEKDQTARAEFHRLPADFRADAAAGAGDDYIFGGEESLQFWCVEADRLAAEEVGQVWIIVRGGAARVAGLGREGAQFLRSRFGHVDTNHSSAK
jgi:hypothetical protein